MRCKSYAPKEGYRYQVLQKFGRSWVHFIYLRSINGFTPDNTYKVIELPKKYWPQTLWCNLLHEIHTAMDGGGSYGVDYPTLLAVRPDLAAKYMKYRWEFFGSKA